MRDECVELVERERGRVAPADWAAVPNLPGPGHAQQGRLEGRGGFAGLAAMLPLLASQSHVSGNEI